MKYIIGIFIGAILAAGGAVIAQQVQQVDAVFSVATTTPPYVKLFSEGEQSLYEQNVAIMKRLDYIEAQLDWIKRYKKI